MTSVVEQYLARIESGCLPLDAGAVADYIPELASVDATTFAVSLVVHDGHVYSVGDSTLEFTIQSISKALTYALALRDRGVEVVDAHIGVEPSGEAFNEISVDHRTRRPRNPMINAGAITATALLIRPDKDGQQPTTREEWAPVLDTAFASILEFYSGCAGRQLSMDRAVYASEMATGSRNRAIAYMLQSFGVFPSHPQAAVDLYVRQCSVRVTSDDLAVIGSTFANGGVNPRTGRRMVDGQIARRVLSVMTTCGMYDGAGDWVTTVGLPAKSGVGGGILAVLPGQLGIGVFSPRLDEHGNSVRGVRACRLLSEDLGLHMFTVARESRVTIRSVYDGRELDPAATERSVRDATFLRAHRERIRVLELQGDLTFSGVESVVRRVEALQNRTDVFLIDLSRVGVVDDVSRRLLVALLRTRRDGAAGWVVVDPDGVLSGHGAPPRAPDSTPGGDDVAVTSSSAEAVEIAETMLLGRAERSG
ncbi:glutaminase A [Williamsia deligens]|uniref:Glutaminase n=1 Tax=Williamsia deligens TaxID=321325 RepID=A0ABW3GBX9_9NOCA|nr:glutaminase A [Williamsia deligens]MCP2195136.1 L-glutaminase [Williamsia deligens]